MAISFAEPRLAPLMETDPAWKPFGLFARLPPAMEMLEEEFTEDALPRFGGRLQRSRSWSGYAAHRAAKDRRAATAGKVSPDATSTKCAPPGDHGESQCSTTWTPATTGTSWASESEEDHADQLAKFETPRRLSAPGFMDTPAGGAAASPAAAAGSACAEGAVPQAPPTQAPQIVTTLMVQNLDRSLTRRGFMNSLDNQGFAGKYDFVHLPKSFGTRRNNGFAFVNFMKLEDAEEFARRLVRIKGSKVRAVPADVQGSANAAKASSRKTARIRDGSSRPLVVPGLGQDALLRA